MNCDTYVIIYYRVTFDMAMNLENPIYDNEVKAYVFGSNLNVYENYLDL